MLYTPLLPEAASGTLEPRHVVVPLREMCPHAELVLGRVTSHDPERKAVVVESLAGELEIGYERLVVALGATTRTFPVPGLLEHGVGFKDLADAIALRNRVLLQLERASIHPDDPAELGFVFVGAGYAGVEALAELHDMTQAALRSYPGLRDVTTALGARGRRAEDPPRDPSPARRVRRAPARATRNRDPRLDDARVVRRQRGAARRRHAGTGEDAGLDGRGSSEPAAARARAPARRARACRRRRDAPRRGNRGRVGARRLRGGQELQDAGQSSTRRRASTRCARRAGSRRT